MPTRDCLMMLQHDWLSMMLQCDWLPMQRRDWLLIL